MPRERLGTSVNHPPVRCPRRSTGSHRHLTVPEARSPEEQGAALEAEFSTELARSYALIAEAGSDEECILPSMLMETAGKLSILATDLSLRSDRNAAEVIRSIGGQ